MRRKLIVAIVVAPLLALAAVSATPSAQQRALASGTAPGQTVSASAASSWQTNATVVTTAYLGGNVYIGGDFTSVRPPGAPLGTGEVPSVHLAVLSASTGELVQAFPNGPDAEVHSLAPSPDGTRVYLGGSFTQLNGLAQGYLAAISTSTFDVEQTFRPALNGQVRSVGVSTDNATVYAGGVFKNSGAVVRRNAAAFDINGGLLPWYPAVTSAITAIATTSVRVLIGGEFLSINGNTAYHKFGAVDPATGKTTQTDLANLQPADSTYCVTEVKDILVNGTTAYVASEGMGSGCFDGVWAVDLSTGAALWQNYCLGATQSVAIVNGILYKGSHAHDCSYSPGGFPQSGPRPGYENKRLLAESLTDGTLEHYNATTDGHSVGPRSLSTDGSQLFVGGDFWTVNGKPQQGFARFTSTDVTKPVTPSAPIAISTTAGTVALSIPATYDNDDGTLTYNVYRSGTATPIAQFTATSWPWTLPLLHVWDTGLTPGAVYTYTVVATDGINTSTASAPSNSVTVASTTPIATYRQRVLGGSPTFYWPLTETSGTTAADASGHGFTGIYKPGATPGQTAGPLPGQTAVGLDGITGNVTAARSVLSPQVFSIEGWFKTTTRTGGKLIGFGNAQTGSSSTFDRHIYMTNDGRLTFGVSNGAPQRVTSANAFNDGQWHHVVATLGAGGMALYVDGLPAGTNPGVTSAIAYTGYWRVGGDNLNTWGDPYARMVPVVTTPNSYYLNGSVAQVAVYPTALTAASVATHYASATHQQGH